ncbi:MAG: FMN-binding glutamate synthase family protein, partial [Alcanivorax sp.]|nr:FMN-binding glutamate synthase family protein [Alcanivorax sp.]
MADSTTGPGRFIGPVIAAVIFLGGGVALFFYPASPWLWLLTLVALALLAQGLRDLLQHRHTLLRNYPLLAHFRWFFEFLRPFLRQYIVENDREVRPYNRDR